MTTSLSKDLRNLLEKVTAAARTLAESACHAALENLAVHEKEYRAHMSIEQRLLRNRLRARSRALGDKRDERSGMHEIHHITELAAYEHWHRLLFTRFLTENHLLITDEAHGRIPVTLEECEELAKDLGARDGLDLACRFASRTLPGVFRSDDPVLDLPIALNDQVEMRKLLSSLPSEVFRADDALGWTYQFWQAQRKEKIRKSGKKVGADELSPVTQLFTEDYMVDFLLHNSIGAWWAGKRGPITAETEKEARAQVALDPRDGVGAISWSYLRFVQDAATKTWLPAAGIFEGWPQTAKLIRLLDPCMGSGHFLVFALPLLVRLRMEEENLDAQAAVVVVLNDNIHGLELDERCTQIAVFNVALTAWKLAGYQLLPALHIACSGLAPNATKEEWIALAGKTDRLRRGMARLYDLFADAPVLGSLINPGAFAGDMIEADFQELFPIFMEILSLNETIKTESENEAFELAVIAQGLTKAVELLSGNFTLVITNVPYLARGKQSDTLCTFCDRHYPAARNDLATVFLDRSLEFCSKGGTSSLVLPQNWLFAIWYKDFRTKLLKSVKWDFLARLGAGAFETINGEVVKAILISVTKSIPVRLLFDVSHFEVMFSGVDVSNSSPATAKANALKDVNIFIVNQALQLKNPDARVMLGKSTSGALLAEYADCMVGMQSSDDSMFLLRFWELHNITKKTWEYLQGAPEGFKYDAGMSWLVRWEKGEGLLLSLPTAYPTKGLKALGKSAVAIHRVGSIYAYYYSKERFHQNIAVVLPKDQSCLPAIFSYCSSEQYKIDVRQIDQRMNVTNATLGKVAFDLDRWTIVAEEKYPNGLPKPYSDP
ncbi:MAG: SAM-dependent DNA methyltransferase [Geobacteraceae bacterium]|nr:SAM-dependent DNA methyltransferase [Geobacteraceae bacterium]